MAKHSPSHDHRLPAEPITANRHRALTAAANLAALCCSQASTTLGGITTFFLTNDPAFHRHHAAGPGYGCPRIVVDEDDIIHYYAGSMNVDNLPLLIQNLRQERVDLRSWDRYADAILLEDRDSLAGDYKHHW